MRDVVVFTKNNFHKNAEPCFAQFEANREIFYRLEGDHNEDGTLQKIYLQRSN